jgi:hypothetical protein
MPIRFPPRREPRILSVATIQNGLIFTVVDPWVIRGSGRLRCREPSYRSAMIRLVRREKPTAIVTNDVALTEAARTVASHCGIAMITKRPPRIPVSIAKDLYPELPLFAPGRLSRLAALGISAVLNRTTSHRTYANTRHNATQRQS